MLVEMTGRNQMYVLECIPHHKRKCYSIMKLTSINHKLPTIVFDLFRKWVENACELYSDLDFTISEELVLVNVLSSTLEHVREAL